MNSISEQMQNIKKQMESINDVKKGIKLVSALKVIKQSLDSLSFVGKAQGDAPTKGPLEKMIEKTLKEYNDGKLKDSEGFIIKDKDQALGIAFSRFRGKKKEGKVDNS